jgi:hypothetical protein
MSRVQIVTDAAATAEASLETAAKVYDGTVYAGHAGTLRAIAQNIHACFNTQMTDAARALDAQAPTPPVPAPAPPATQPPVVTIAGLKIKTINGRVPAAGTGNVRYFTGGTGAGYNVESAGELSGGFFVDDCLAFRFKCPVDLTPYFAITYSQHGSGATGANYFRTLTLSTTAGDFGKGLWTGAGNSGNINLSNMPGKQRITLTPGETYYLNICNRYEGKPTITTPPYRGDMLINVSHPSH